MIKIYIYASHNTILDAWDASLIYGAALSGYIHFFIHYMFGVSYPFAPHHAIHHAQAVQSALTFTLKQITSFPTVFFFKTLQELPWRPAHFRQE